jgi:hypothetical protein
MFVYKEASLTQAVSQASKQINNKKLKINATQIKIYKLNKFKT